MIDGVTNHKQAAKSQQQKTRMPFVTKSGKEAAFYPTKKHAKHAFKDNTLIQNESALINVIPISHHKKTLHFMHTPFYFNPFF